MTHDRPGVRDQAFHLVMGHVVTAIGDHRRTGGAVLHEALRPLGAVREPRFDPADQAVEGMMIGADGDEDVRPIGSSDRSWLAHSSGPTTSPFGYIAFCSSH